MKKPVLKRDQFYVVRNFGQKLKFIRSEKNGEELIMMSSNGQVHTIDWYDVILPIARSLFQVLLNWLKYRIK